MAYATTETLLPLDRYGELMGLPPLGLNGAGVGESGAALAGDCTDIWPQLRWQKPELVSLEELGEVIAGAEEEMARYLGAWPGRHWIEAEEHEWPAHYRAGRERCWRDAQGLPVRFTLDWRKPVQAGRRTVTLLGTATAGSELVYSDADSDGLTDTATVTLSDLDITGMEGVGVWLPGYDGQRPYRVPHTSMSLAGGTLTVTLPSWRLVKPSLRESFSWDGTAISVDDTANLVTSVELYREHVDPSQAAAELVWLPRTRLYLDEWADVTPNETTTQPARISLVDRRLGLVSVEPISIAGQIQTVVNPVIARPPDLVRFWYQSGWDGETVFDAHPSMALAIAEMATARLSRPLSTCLRILDRAAKLQRDTGYSSQEEGNYGRKLAAQMETPFGTRLGEVEAARRLRLWKERVE